MKILIKLRLTKLDDDLFMHLIRYYLIKFKFIV